MLCFLFFPVESLKRVAFASSVDLNKVISPVGQYIRSNPVPPIMRQIRPKNIKRLDDDLAAFERDEEMCKTSPAEKEKKRMFKPIPRAEYTSSRVAFEQPVSSPNNGDEMATLPKVFGMAPTVQATVILMFFDCLLRACQTKIKITPILLSNGPKHLYTIY